jgi:ABC-type amino acid transport system permease subunit
MRGPVTISSKVETTGRDTDAQAGVSVGLVFPQALFNVLPGMTSQFISTLKETSLGYVIAVTS